MHAPTANTLPTKEVFTLRAAKTIADAAEAEAQRRGATVVIVVVDDAGHMLVLHRLDDTQVASVEVGIAKARTAAIFRRPSKVFEDQVKNGRISALALPGAAALQDRRQRQHPSGRRGHREGWRRSPYRSLNRPTPARRPSVGCPPSTGAPPPCRTARR
jgi:hypothetical protein